ncbi:MAG: hypothetical protein JO125_12120 [Chloroflexi bacterium]|nr:hypothetical protein [Ktedonobacteraceae bacterium]MBV9021886.1 hypothetical protein [Ktedonobacteraceae bacterium]MBV9708142.1 hypothetical protein [Chloroflexota bacterium]
MTISQRPIFRDRAMKHYLQKGEQDVLPHLITPPIFLLLWIVLGLLLIVTVWLLPGLRGLIGG